MFENIRNILKKTRKNGKDNKSKEQAKERLHLVLMQDRANVSADFLDIMRREIIEVIKKYIDVEEKDIDVRLTNKPNDDGTMGAPALYANIPIIGIKDNFKVREDAVKESIENKKTKEVKEEKQEETKVEDKKEEKEVKEEVKKEEKKAPTVKRVSSSNNNTKKTTVNKTKKKSSKK